MFRYLCIILVFVQGLVQAQNGEFYFFLINHF